MPSNDRVRELLIDIILSQGGDSLCDGYCEGIADKILSQLAEVVRGMKDCRDGSMSTREAYNLACEDIANLFKPEETK